MRQYFLIKQNADRNSIVSKPIGKQNRMGRGYISISELRKANGVLDKRCVHCNGLVVTYYRNMDEDVKRMIENNHCNHCDFWLRKPKELPNSFRIDGCHYNNWTEYNEDGTIKNGEVHMEITMIETGEVIQVDRLTHQGTIPKRWKTMLPDNATKKNIFLRNRYGKYQNI